MKVKFGCLAKIVGLALSLGFAVLMNQVKEKEAKHQAKQNAWPTLTSPSKEMLQVFGQELQQDLQANEFQKIDKRFDYTRFALRVFDWRQSRGKSPRSFGEKVQQDISKFGGLVGAVVGPILAQQTVLELVSVEPGKKFGIVRFRGTEPTGRVLYIDFLVSLDADQQPVLMDIYPWAMMASLAEEMGFRQKMIALSPKGQMLANAQQETRLHRAMNKAYAQEDFKQTLHLYQQLAKEFQARPDKRAVQFRATALTDPDKAIALGEKLEKDFPRTTGLYQVLFYGYYDAGDFPRATDALEKWKAQVGDDPTFDLLQQRVDLAWSNQANDNQGNGRRRKNG